MLDRCYRSSYRWFPLGIAILLSFAWFQSVPNTPVSDQDIYNRTAISVATGKGLLDDSGNPTAYWAPGYSFYLAAFYFIFGSALSTGFWANWISYLLLLAGVHAFAKQLYSAPIAWLTATLLAWYPTFIFYTTILASEVFFSALLIWALTLSWKTFNVPSRNWFYALASGALFGASILTRPQALVILPVAFAFSLAQRKPFFRSAALFCLLIFTVCVLLFPWGMRNLYRLGEFTLVSANVGANLWIGNHPGATGKYTDINEAFIGESVDRNSLMVRDKILKNKALDFIRSHPGEFALLTLKRAYWTMRSESIGVVWNLLGIQKAFGPSFILPLKIIVNLAYYGLLLGFLVSLYVLVRRRAFQLQDWLLLALLFLLSLPFLIFQGQDRFHLPLIPYLVIFVSRGALLSLQKA